MVIKHKNKKKCIIVKNGNVSTVKYKHADGSVEEIRVQDDIDYGVYIPAKSHLQKQLDMKPGTEIDWLELTEVPVLRKEKSKDFPKGIPTGLTYAGKKV